MSERMQILEDVMIQLNKYSNMEPWRPSLMDIWTYDKLITLHESDYDNNSDIPDFVWKNTPDEIMQIIIDKGPIFDMEYGWENFDEQVRDYLIMNDFIVDPLDEEVEEEKE